jgi:uncharacterized protein DUF4194
MLREYSLSLISLLKGIVYGHQKEVWENLMYHEADVKKYFSALGLELWLDKSEQYAYLRQADLEEFQQVPKLAEKRPLNFQVSLLCLLLRKQLLESDAQGGAGKTTIGYNDILNKMLPFLADSSDEAKQQDKLLSSINKVIEIGFLKKLEDGSGEYEIHRIIKAFVNADVVDDMVNKLQRYAAEKNSDS